MSKRIKSIIKYINKNDIVLDIGCDMAILGIELAKKKIYSHASDLRENIIKNAKVKIKNLGFEDFITFYISDGLKNIDNNEINTLVLAGMGTNLIISILKESTKKYKKIITISNNDHYFLRNYMIKNSYKIFKEEIIYEKNKFYNLIVFIKGDKEYSKEDLIIGVNHQNKELLNKKNKYLIDKYKKILKNNLPKKDRERLENLIKILEKKR